MTLTVIYRCVMRVAYGYKRREGGFTGLDVERIWIDGDGTERSERHSMLNGGLRPGDVLVLLSRGDLSTGKNINDIVAEVEARGATIEVIEVIRPRGRPGPKPEWEPSDDLRFRRLWKDLTVHGPYVVRLACEDAGVEPTKENRTLFRSRLVRRYGTRKAK